MWFLWICSALKLKSLHTDALLSVFRAEKQNTVEVFWLRMNTAEQQLGSVPAELAAAGEKRFPVLNWERIRFIQQAGSLKRCVCVCGRGLHAPSAHRGLAPVRSWLDSQQRNPYIRHCCAYRLSEFMVFPQNERTRAMWCFNVLLNPFHNRIIECYLKNVL